MRPPASAVLLGILLLLPTVLLLSPASADRILTAYPGNGDVVSGIRKFFLQDNGGASKAELYIDGVFVASLAPSLPPWQWETTVDTRGWSSGYHVLRYTSYGGSYGDDSRSYSALFDNAPPAITDLSVAYPPKLAAAKNLTQVRIVAHAEDALRNVTVVRADVSKLNSTYLTPTWAQMFDDSLHQDGAAGDLTFGSDPVEVFVPSGFITVPVEAADDQGNRESASVIAEVDNHPPVVRRVTVIYPPGQSAAKLGDMVRVVAEINDDSFTYVPGVTGSPLDVAIFVDDARFVTPAQWAGIESALLSFVDGLSTRSRAAVFASAIQGSGEEVTMFTGFIGMDESAIDPRDGFRGTGRAVVKHIISVDDGIHLTAPNGTPAAYRPVWDGIGEAASYAINSAQFGSTPAVIAVVAGDDYGVGGRQVGSEVFVPGSPPDSGSLFSRTWTTMPPSQGAVWGDPKDRVYDTVPRLVGVGPQRWEDVYVQNEPARTGLLGIPIPVMTFSYQLAPQGSNSAQPAYISPSALQSGAPANVSLGALAFNFTVDYDLLQMSATSTLGRHYYAESGGVLSLALADARTRLSSVAAKPIPLNLPRGVLEFGANVSSLGYSDPVAMYDDGQHQDAFVGDGVFGSDLQAAGSKRTGRELVNVFASDIAGTLTSTQVLISLDNDPPVTSDVRFYYAGAKGSVPDGATTYVSARVADIGPVADIDVRLLASLATPEVRMFDDGAGNDAIAGDGVYTSRTFTVPLGAPNGANLVRVEALDAARQRGVAPGLLVVSNPPPSVIFLNPVDGGYLQGSTTLRVNVTDDRVFATPEWSPDGQPWKPTFPIGGQPYNFTAFLNTTGMVEGVHNVSVRATDLSGNLRVGVANFTLDLDPPTILAEFPRNRSYMSGNVTLRVYAADSVGIGGVAAQLFGQVFVLGYNSQTGFYEARVDSRQAPDGSYDYTILAADLSGRIVFQILRVFVDNSPPSLELVEPRPRAVVGGAVTVLATVKDLGPVALTYSVGPLSNVNITEPWNTTRMEDGAYTFTLRGRDSAGLESAVSVDVLVDNSPPVIIPLKVPPEPSRLKGEVEVRVKVEDASLEVVSLSMAAGASLYLVCSDFKEEFVCDLNTTQFPDRNYTLLIEARDVVGHITTLVRNATIDNTPPAVSVIPNNQRTVSGDVLLEIEARDLLSPTVGVEVRVNGGTWQGAPQDLGSRSYKYTWRTSSLPNGQHIVEVRATDEGGNSQVYTYRYVVENPRTAPLYAFIIGTVAAIAFFYWLTRKEDIEEEEWYEERGPQYIVVPQPVPQPFVVQVPVQPIAEGEPGSRPAGDETAGADVSTAQPAAATVASAAGPTTASASAGEPARRPVRAEDVVVMRRLTLEERRALLRDRVGRK